MQKPRGLKLRGGIWHADKVIRAAGLRLSIRRTTGYREEEADQAAALLERWIAEAREEAINGPRRREHTFDEAAVQYVLEIERKGKSPARAVQDLRLVSPAIGGLPLSHVHQGTLSDWERGQRGQRRSSTVARVYRTVVAVLNHAARTLRDDNRPWLSTAVPRIGAPDWADRLPPHRLTWEEQDRLMSHLPAHSVPMALFAVSTGAREQEVCRLRWEWEVRVDGLPAGSVWRIPAEVRKGNARKTASQQQGRYLMANRTARSVIDAQRGNGSAWVFPGPSGKPLGRLNNTGWRTAWRRAGLPTDGKRGVHNLRHTWGERAEAAGVPWEYRKTLLGHEVQDVTVHYSRPGLARLLEWAELVERETAPQLRPVTQTPHSGKTERGIRAAK